MPDQQDKARITYWSAIAVTALAAYALSIGPMCWMVERGIVSAHRAAVAYEPWLWLDFHASRRAQDAVFFYARVWRGGGGLGALRDEPIRRRYSVGDLAYRLVDDRPVFDVWDTFTGLLWTTVEPDSWEELNGRGVVRAESGSQSVDVLQSRRVHAALADFLAELRQIKEAHRNIREMDLWALLRAYYGRHGVWLCKEYLEKELLSRAILVGSLGGRALGLNGDHVQDVDFLIASLDHEPRDRLRRGIFWNTPFHGPTPEVEDRLRAFCHSKDVDLFVERPLNCFGCCPPNIHWIEHASDSEYLD